MSLADFQTLNGSQDCHGVVHSSQLNIIQSISPWALHLFQNTVPLMCTNASLLTLFFSSVWGILIY